jgi:hypothetical protein
LEKIEIMEYLLGMSIFLALGIIFFGLRFGRIKRKFNKLKELTDGKIIREPGFYTLADKKIEYDTEFICELEDGKRFYMFKDPMNMPQSRLLEAQLRTKMAEMNINLEGLYDYTDAQRKSMNEGDFVTAASLLDRLEERLTWACEERTLMDLACVLIFHEDEDKFKVTDKWDNYKRNLMDTNPDIRAVFTQRAYSSLNGSEKRTEEEVSAYLGRPGIKDRQRLSPKK